MKKRAVCAAVLLLAMTGLGWSWSGRSVPEPPQASSSAVDPYSTPEAQRHFNGQPRHWAAMVLVLD
jgi:hypothetical protein